MVALRGFVLSASVAAAALAALLFPALAEVPPLVPSPPGVEQLNGEHPSEYYRRAAVLFKEDKKDEAVFIFYLGQLRYRARLLSHPALDPSGEPALFTSFQQVVGKPVNEHAFGDIPRLLTTLDAVLIYDRGHPDKFTPPSTFPEAWRQTREGLSRMRAQVEKDADKIRASRERNGLPNG
jgi:hypothetical protein